MKEIRKVYFTQQRSYFFRWLRHVGGAFLMAFLLGGVYKALDKEKNLGNKQ